MEKPKNTNESLEIIVRAEEHAEQIRKAAIDAARQMVAEAEMKNAARIQEETDAAMDEKRRTLEEITLKADGIIQSELKDARKDADRISTRSSKHMADAVRAICWEMCGQ
ncbi:MAG: hypothetical protein MJ137_05135 [Clostridia bacterium]|nr:hypothetical protein [Clostridia bacterium]